MKYDFLIVGGGAAGMAAAAAAAACGRSVLLAERAHTLGGILNQCIHNGFGLVCFQEDLTGTAYAARCRDRLSGLHPEIRTDCDVIRISEDRTAILSGNGGVTRVSFTHCIMATGCRERNIGAAMVGGTRPAGIFTAGEAQELINLHHCDIGDRFVILGSGNVGQIMARQLKQLGKEVVAVVEQNDVLGGISRHRHDCIEAYQIPVIFRATVDMIRGEGRVSAVRVKYLDTGETALLDCDTLITAMGLLPDREPAAHLINGDTYPDWLHFCGNCESVHEIVDTVTMQAEALASALCGRMEEQHHAECSDAG